ncbi:hypothetical protein ACLUWT_08130 [Limosilactobacillus mucosae]
MMNQMGVTMIPDSADFRLMSNQAVHALLKYSERNLFLRGLVPQLGFQTGKVYYQRTARLAGETKYPFKKMVGLALNGITSLISVPLRLIFWLGTITCLLSAGMGIFTLIVHITGYTVSGWSSLMLSLWFIGGAQRSQLSTQYHARPTYLKPGQIVSQQIKLNGEGQYLSVQIHQDSSLKVSLHDQQNGQTWYLKRRGVHIDYFDP